LAQHFPDLPPTPGTCQSIEPSRLGDSTIRDPGGKKPTQGAFRKYGNVQMGIFPQNRDLTKKTLFETTTYSFDGLKKYLF